MPKTTDTVTAQKVFDTKQRQVSDVFVGQVSRQPVINVEVPVFEGGQVRYVLIMALDATRFEQMLQSQRLESDWITGITDNKGIILARSERHADFVGKPLPKELLEQSRNGKRRVPGHQRGGTGDSPRDRPIGRRGLARIGDRAARASRGLAPARPGVCRRDDGHGTWAGGGACVHIRHV